MKILFCFYIVTLSMYLNAQKAFESANILFDKKNYIEAINLYESALNETKTQYIEQLIHYRLGLCNKEVHNYEKSLKHFEISYKLGNDDPQIYLEITSLLIVYGYYDEAVEFLKPKIKKLSNKDYGFHLLNICEYAINNKASTPNIKILNLTELNSRYSEFGLCLLNDNLIFSSSRIEDNSQSIYNLNGQAYTEFYFSFYNEDSNSWENPEKLNGKINSPFNEGSCTFDSTSNTLYFMQCNGFNGKSDNCQIYSSEYDPENKTWSKPVNILLDQKEYNYGHPFICDKGNKLFFSSDMPGGFGGKDIWYTNKRDDQTWSEPINAGHNVNTKYDEVFPYVFNDTVLYFSSDGHTGYGELDIFCSEIGNNSFSKPTNMGHPINSSTDDFNILLFTSDSGLLCSQRKEGLGDDDIYLFYKTFKFKNIRGQINDLQNGNPLANVSIYLSDINNIIDSTKSNNMGIFELNSIDINKVYGVSFKKKGYLDEIRVIKPSLINERTEEDVDLSFFLVPVTEQEIRLKNIYYDFGKWNLTPESKIELIKLYNLMKSNPKIKIHINSHTDNIGDEDFNNKLSNYRAQSVIKFLMEMGIDENRLSYKGWGESKPVIVNAKTPGELQLNRRTTFQVSNIEELKNYNSHRYLRLTDSVMIASNYEIERYEGIISKESEKVVFRLQFYAGKEKIPNSLKTQVEKLIGNHKIISIKEPGGYRRYAIGDFRLFDEAINLQKRLTEYGINTYIMAFKNNLRITILEARQLTE